MRSSWLVMGILFCGAAPLVAAYGSSVLSVPLASTPSTLQSGYRETMCSPFCSYVGNKGGDQPASQPAPTGWTTQSPLIVALIWALVIIVVGSVLVFFLRFYARHNEHPVLDDRPSSEIWARGLHDYLRLMGKEDEDEQRAERQHNAENT